MGELCIRQATQELEEEPPVPLHGSNTSLLANPRGRALADFQQEHLLGPKKSFPTRILLQLLCLCGEHSFLKVAVS